VPFLESGVDLWRVEADFHNIPLAFNNSPIEAPNSEGTYLYLEAMLLVWKLRFTRPARRGMGQALAATSIALSPPPEAGARLLSIKVLH